MESDLTLLTAILQNPLLTMDEIRREANAFESMAERAQPRRAKTPRDLTTAHALDCCG